MTSPVETPAPKVVCESQDCGKEYASKGGMKNHYKKTHKAAEEIQSPLGKFPTSDSARVLFKESEPSTQGNSLGQVNSPKVTSDGQYICNVCDNYFESKKNIDEHKNKEHDNPSSIAPANPKAAGTTTTATPPSPKSQGVAENDNNEASTAEKDNLTDSQQLQEEDEVLEEAKEDQDLYDELEKLSKEIKESENGKEANKELLDKLERFKAILRIKERYAKSYEFYGLHTAARPS